MKAFMLLLMSVFLYGQSQTIRIQPFVGVPPYITEHVFSEIKKIYPNTILSNPTYLPKSAYYAPRNRYKASQLLGYLDKSGYITLGLTNMDISTAAHGYADWGVMGLSECPGSASVVSTYRLDKKNLLEQTLKVCVHELGHAEGLPHCQKSTCLMADAKGKNPTNQEKGFCDSCKKYLKSKGWKI